jgi:hypothetical protein
MLPLKAGDARGMSREVYGNHVSRLPQIVAPAKAGVLGKRC